MATRAQKAATAVAPDAETPTSVTLASPYGFYDDDNNLRMWQEGQEVTDPEHIATLIERQAPLKD